MNPLLIVPIWTHEETFAIGVFSSTEEAEREFIEYMIVKRPKVYREFLKKLSARFGIKKPDRDALFEVFFGDNQDITDFANDELNFVIETVDARTLFDFRDITSWDEDNLYALISAVLNYRLGRLYRLNRPPQ
jgi:hypothetical protein